MTELPLQEMGMVLEYVKGLKQQLEETERDLAIIHESGILQAIPEIVRILYAHRVLSRYGPNQVCRTLKIRKSNLYYHVFRKPEFTAYEKHNQELLPSNSENMCFEPYTNRGRTYSPAVDGTRFYRWEEESATATPGN